MDEKIKALAKIAAAFNGAGIVWALGGSLMLKFYGIPCEFNDLDIIVKLEDAKRAAEILACFSTPLKTVKSEIYTSPHYYKFSCSGVEVDLIGGFAIENAAGRYVYHFDENWLGPAAAALGENVPLCLVEDWWVLYQLMERAGKVEMLNAYFAISPPTCPTALQRALKQPLPPMVLHKIEALVLKCGM